MQEKRHVTFNNIEKKDALRDYLNKKFGTKHTNTISKMLAEYQDEYIDAIENTIKNNTIPDENRKFMSNRYRNLSDQEIIDDVFAFSDFMMTFIDISTERIKNFDAKKCAEDIADYISTHDGWWNE